MGHLRQGLFCPGGGKGPQTRVLCQTPCVSTRTTSSTEIEGRPKKVNPGGGRFPVDEGGNRTSQRQESGVLFKPLPGEEVRWRTKASHQSEGTEPLHKEEKLQDGFDTRCLSEYPPRRLGLNDRPQGCLSPCAYSKGAQEIPAVLVGRTDLSVQTSAFRAQFGPKDLHKGNSAHSDPVSSKGDQNYRLPGRFPHPSTQQEGAVNTHLSGIGCVRQGWFSAKPQEVSPSTKSEVQVLGPIVGFKRVEGSTTSRQDFGLQHLGIRSSEESFLGYGTELLGKSYFCPQSGAFGTSTPKSASDGGDTRPTVCSVQVGPGGQGFSKVVVSSPQRGGGTGEERSISGFDDGCLQQWLGSHPREQVCQRQMVKGRGQIPYQPPGASGCPQGDPQFHSLLEGKDDCHPPRQRDGNVVFEQRGWNEISRSQQADFGYPVVLSESLLHSDPFLPARCGQSGSGRSLKGTDHEGMVSAPQDCGEGLQEDGKTSSGPICFSKICTATSVFLPREGGQAVSRTECTGAGLELQKDVCFSSTSAHSLDTSKAEGSQGSSNLDYSFLDEVSMVAGASPAIDSSSSSSPCSSGHSDGSEHGEPAAFAEEAQIDSMVHLQHTFRREGADQTLAEFICGAWRGSTKDQYKCAWRSWSDWCNRLSLPKTSPTLGQFISYLWHLYNDRSLAWSSIRVHRAAIATIVDPLTSSPLSQHPMVIRFMKAVFMARPPARKVKPIWSVSTVLEMLRNWGPSEELERSRLTWRLTMLLALASARRASDLTLFHIDEDHLVKSAESWRFHLAFGAKQDRPGHISPDVMISRQGSPELCPILNAEEYLRRTADERGDHVQLLRTTLTPFRPAMKQTVRSWLSKVLELAGIEAPGGSTRAASATWASARAVPIVAPGRCPSGVAARGPQSIYMKCYMHR